MDLFFKIKEYIGREKPFTKNEIKIFNYLFLTNRNSLGARPGSTMIANRAGMSPGYVQHIVLKLIGQFNSYFSFVESYTNHDLEQYTINQHSDLIIVDEKLADFINEQEGTRFNHFFIAKVLSIVLSQTHGLMSDERIIGPYRYYHKVPNTFKSFYLVSSKLTKNFPLTQFIKDVYFQLNRKIVMPYSQPLEDILKKYGVKKQLKHFERLATLCKSLVKSEFGVETSDGLLLIQRNSKKQKHEYLFEILEYAGKPLTINEIRKLSKKLFPKVPFKRHSFVSGMQKYKSTFVTISRFYGLKKWETEMHYFRGGTIRDIVEGYLKQSDEPKLRTEVSDYVKKFRPDTNANSIYSNIRQMSPQRFLLGNRYIGLLDKKYDPSSPIYYIRKSRLVLDKPTTPHIDWKVWCRMIKNFKQSHKGRLPSAHSATLEERSLYYFMKRARKAFVKNRLNKEQIIQLRDLGIIRI